MEDFQTLKTLIQDIEEDVAKAEGGNRAAGTRVRKAMQEIKNAAQTVRKKILEVRSSEGATP
ncbi:MAG: histone H1 [Phycisphaerae bacterium]